ncbi:MAG: glycosyltransferase [Williamsia sp.]|nr:glycosyltransferase [Williamsia sp.]
MLILFYITLILLFVYGPLIKYYERAWKGIPTWSQQAQTHAVKVTVIVPARNEEENIGHCLYSLSTQEYPADLLQIIVVNDHSADNTARIVVEYPASNVQLVNLSDYVSNPINSYKKKAIEIGVGLAEGELIITTDADCTAGPRWISSLVDCYLARGAVFIAAPVKIEAGKTLLSVFQSLDFLTLQGITGASVHKRFHSMCNGANMAYSRQVFYEVDGFRGIDNIASGDDMLLMHKIFAKYPRNVFFVKNKDAIVSTQAAGDWKAFFNQRIRWASKADKYNDKRITAVLVLVYFLNVFCLCFLVAGLWNPRWLLFFLILVLVKTGWEIFFVRAVAAFFNQQSLLIYFPLLQPLHIAYTVAAGFLGKFGRYEWKSRKVK